MGGLAHRIDAKSVVLLGDTNIDLVLDVAALPLPGEDALASSQTVGVGGSVTNTAILLRRLGAQPEVVSCVGDDAWAALAKQALQETGLAVGHIATVKAAGTSLNVVAVTPDGERTMLACRGASARLDASNVPDQAIREAAWLHVSGYAFLTEPQRTAARHALDTARSAGVATSLDLPVGPTASVREVVLASLENLNVLVVGRPEAAELLALNAGHKLSDEMIGARLLEHGPRLVALKRGAKGAVFCDGRGATFVPAPSVRAIDTTGAGDAFSAGVIAGAIAGWSLAELGRLAVSCGAAAVVRRGAGTNMPSLADVAGSLNLAH